MPGSVFIEGDSISLRTVEEDDIRFLRDGINHPEVRVDVGSHEPKNLEDQRTFFEETICGDDSVHLLVCESGEPMGIVGLDPQESDPERVGRLGIWLHPDYHGEGYGTEAMEVFVTYAFDQLNYHKLYARTHEDNTASQRLFEKIGFEQEGRFQDHAYLNGGYKDLVYYGVVATDW